LVRPLLWTSGIVVVALVLIAGCIAMYVRSYVKTQQHNMSLARERAAAVQARIGTDPRFVEVQFEPFTSDNGCLLIDGAVLAANDLATLKTIVEQTPPAVHVRWGVTIKRPSAPGGP
jgi:hypothetical protein